MVPEYLDTLDLRLSARLVLVEEVAAKQHHVHLLLHPDAEKLIEAVEAVHAALRVLLGVSQVNVTRYQDPEEVTRVILIAVRLRKVTQGHLHALRPLLFLQKEKDCEKIY